MLNFKEAEDFLEEFKNLVVREAKHNLSKKRKRVTKNSMKV